MIRWDLRTTLGLLIDLSAGGAAAHSILSESPIRILVDYSVSLTCPICDQFGYGAIEFCSIRITKKFAHKITISRTFDPLHKGAISARPGLMPGDL
jgi:hypothetical protein